MKYCCEQMKYFISRNDSEFNSDDIIYYIPEFDEYGIVIHDGGSSSITIEYCPWCGKNYLIQKGNYGLRNWKKGGLKIRQKMKSRWSLGQISGGGNGLSCIIKTPLS